MSAKILYGKDFAEQIKNSARLEVEEIKNNFGVTPGLAVIIVGENQFTSATNIKPAKNSE